MEQPVDSIVYRSTYTVPLLFLRYTYARGRTAGWFWQAHPTTRLSKTTPRHPLNSEGDEPTPHSCKMARGRRNGVASAWGTFALGQNVIFNCLGVVLVIGENSEGTSSLQRCLFCVLFVFGNVKVQEGKLLYQFLRVS